MKFSFFTDIHLTDHCPKYRVDGYKSALVRKLETVYKLSRENDCECVSFGGDFFDRYNVADFSIIQNAIETVEASGLQTYAAIGEHDLYSHNPETFPSTTLSFFCKFATSFHNLWEPVHLENGVSFYGKHEWMTMETASKIQVDPNRYNILLCHELLYNKKMPFGIVNTADLDLPFDLVCSGDLHCGYKPHKVRNTWYCNPGSLARKATSDANRMPKMLFIEVMKGYDPIIREQVLPGFGPGNQVFAKGISETIREFESEINMNGFIECFNDLKVERTEIFSLFEEYCLKNPVKEDVCEYIKECKMRKEQK